MKNKDIYDFGLCQICHKWANLKNELCINCNDKDLPDVLKDLFKEKGEND